MVALRGLLLLALPWSSAPRRMEDAQLFPGQPQEHSPALGSGQAPNAAPNDTEPDTSFLRTLLIRRSTMKKDSRKRRDSRRAPPPGEGGKPAPGEEEKEEAPGAASSGGEVDKAPSKPWVPSSGEGGKPAPGEEEKEEAGKASSLSRKSSLRESFRNMFLSRSKRKAKKQEKDGEAEEEEGEEEDEEEEADQEASATTDAAYATDATDGAAPGTAHVDVKPKAGGSAEDGKGLSALADQVARAARASAGAARPVAKGESMEMLAQELHGIVLANMCKASSEAELELGLELHPLRCVERLFVHYAIAYHFQGVITAELLRFDEPSTKPVEVEKMKDLDGELHALMMAHAESKVEEFGIVVQKGGGWREQDIYKWAILGCVKSGSFQGGTQAEHALMWELQISRVNFFNKVVRGPEAKITLAKQLEFHMMRMLILEELGNVMRAVPDKWLVLRYLFQLTFDDISSEMQKETARKALRCYVGDDPVRAPAWCLPVLLSSQVVKDAMVILLNLMLPREEWAKRWRSEAARLDRVLRETVGAPAAWAHEEAQH